MTRREFTERMAQIDPESEEAVDKLAALFEEDYLSSGKDLNDPAVIEEIHIAAKTDLEHFKGRYDELLEKINGELRKAGANVEERQAEIIVHGRPSGLEGGVEINARQLECLRGSGTGQSVNAIKPTVVEKCLNQSAIANNSDCYIPVFIGNTESRKRMTKSFVISFCRQTPFKAGF